jgi:RNA recognition motif-containing protein
MNSSNKTLWLGNIESWMDTMFLKKFLEEINIFPKKISLKIKETKRGCAFLEFESHESAEKAINNYNGKIHRNIEIKLNWVRDKNRHIIKPIKFTVRIIIKIIFSYLWEI